MGACHNNHFGVRLSDQGLYYHLVTFLEGVGEEWPVEGLELEHQSHQKFNQITIFLEKSSFLYMLEFEAAPHCY